MFLAWLIVEQLEEALYIFIKTGEKLLQLSEKGRAEGDHILPTFGGIVDLISCNLQCLGNLFVAIAIGTICKSLSNKSMGKQELRKVVRWEPTNGLF